MRRLCTDAVICRYFSIARTFVVPAVLGLGFLTSTLSLASSTQAAADETNSPANESVSRSDTALIYELLVSDERDAARITEELQQKNRHASSIADRASDHVHDRQLKPHVRIALLQILLANDPATKRSLDIFTAIALDRRSAEAMRKVALEGLPAIGKHRKETLKVVDTSLRIAEDRRESSLLRISALYVAMNAGGATEAELRMIVKILKNSSEDVELRSGVARSLSVFCLIAPEQSESIAIALLDVGHSRNAPRKLRLEALDTCWNVILKAELLDTRFEQARAAIHRHSRPAFLDEQEDLAIRAAAGELLCALRRPDRAIVDDLIKVPKSTNAELQDIAARIIRKIGPDAAKARAYLVEIRDRSDINDSLRKSVNEALLSLDTGK